MAQDEKKKRVALEQDESEDQKIEEHRVPGSEADSITIESISMELDKRNIKSTAKMSVELPSLDKGNVIILKAEKNDKDFSMKNKDDRIA